MNKKTIIIMAVLLALVILGAGGWYFYTFKYEDWRMERLAKSVEYGDNFLKQYQTAKTRIKNNPGDAEAYADLGAARAALKDYAGAEADYSIALKLDGNNLSILNSAADFYISRQDYPKAEECYLKMLDVNPVYGPAYQGLVALYNNYYTGKRGEIEEVLLKGLQNSPDDQNLLSPLASYYMTISGEREKALAIYEKMLSLRPNDLLLKAEIKRLRAGK